MQYRLCQCTIKQDFCIIKRTLLKRSEKRLSHIPITYNLFIDPPENVNLKLTSSGQSATIACTAEARPEPSFKIFFNCDMLVKSDKTCTMPEVNSRNIGLYKCVAENILGKRYSISIYLSLGKIKDPVRVCKYFIIFLR